MDSDMERHLFVVWSNGTHALDRIREDLKSWTVIVEETKVDWGSLRRFHRNLRRLYGTKLTAVVRKMRFCGIGPFTVFVVDVPAGPYGERETSRGPRIVHTAMFDAKTRFRSWAGGGSRVHGSDDMVESLRDRQFLLSGRGGHSGRDAGSRQMQPAGADGWDSMSALLEHLGASVTYVVLRNFDGLLDGSSDWLDDEHPDIDLLVADRAAAALALGGRRSPRRPGRARWIVRIEGRLVGFDIRTPADGYLPPSWAQQTLDRRRKGAGGIWLPSDTDHDRALRYHALVHKPEVSATYVEKLGAGQLSEEQLRHDLLATGETFQLPTDPSVPVNETVTGHLPGMRRRRFMVAVWRFGKRIVGVTK